MAKKMVIYGQDEENKMSVPLRTVTVGGDFQGIGTKGQIIRDEFQRLAESLEPAHQKIYILIMDV